MAISDSSELGKYTDRDHRHWVSREGNLDGLLCEGYQRNVARS